MKQKAHLHSTEKNMRPIIFICFLFCSPIVFPQHKEWHVRPLSDNYTNPPNSDGTSFEKAWCIQYALTGGGGKVKPGDTIWLHGESTSTYGSATSTIAYKGHFTSTLIGTAKEYIKVASFPGEWAVFDGNIHNGLKGPIVNPNIGAANYPNLNSPIFILNIEGGFVHFDNFEITCLGNFSRIHETRKESKAKNARSCPDMLAYNFHEYTGIEHSPAENPVRPIIISNIVFRNIPGVAIGSWKFAADTDIYGNIFYHNGIIDVKGSSCQPSLTGMPLTIDITNGKQATIYTQNASPDAKHPRRIRNNIFMNCYDSGLIIWSSNDTPTSREYVRNYLVNKNIFINNGSPVRDETANMIVSTNYNRIRNINIDSNIFFLNEKGSFISGMLINNATNVSITNNAIFNGTAGATFSKTNRAIKYHDNLYVGKRMQILAPSDIYKGKTSSLGPTDKWDFDYNTYFTKNSSTFFQTAPAVPKGTYSRLSPAEFQGADRYHDELHSTIKSYNNQEGGITKPTERYFITQNEYNPNKFSITIYRPVGSIAASTYDVGFSEYNIPNNRHFIVRDVQNYFTKLALGTNFYNPTGSTPYIRFPLGLTAFEPALPTNKAFGPAAITPVAVAHTPPEFITFIVEFDCTYCPDIPFNTTLAKSPLSTKP